MVKYSRGFAGVLFLIISEIATNLQYPVEFVINKKLGG